MRTIIGARGRMGRVGRAVRVLSFLLPFATAVAPTTVDAQTCGLSAGGTLSNVINSYYPGTANANAGATSISVGAIDTSSGGASTAIASGDLLLVIQMQDADINTTNDANYGSNTGNSHGVTNLNSAGLYEYVVAQGAVTAGAVTIRGNGTGGANNGLVNNYHAAAATATAGRKTFQVIRVPMYLTATLSNSLTAASWNGATGGVLAFEVAGLLTLNGATVSVDGLGFRGAGGRALGGDTTGTSATDWVNTTGNAVHGGKGEGISGTPRYTYNSVTNAVVDNTAEGYPAGSMARGAPGNAGGGGTDPRVSANDQNAGGGGGGNGGDGGGGGNSWQSNL